ncbi:hypothetical protein V2J56_08160 [Georgenia sp. MJ206]|uniref:hypothetical protein n=1 Tax=Georgenia wangjunii TaxID=3117730 RepID=UPI002F268DD6
MTDTRLSRRKIWNLRKVSDARLAARIDALGPTYEQWSAVEAERRVLRREALRSGVREVIVQAAGTAVGTGFTAAVVFLLGQWGGVFEASGVFVGVIVGVVALMTCFWVYTVYRVGRLPAKVGEYMEAVAEQDLRYLRAKLDRGEQLTKEEQEIYRRLPYR